MRYPVNLEPDESGSFGVTFPDIPEAITFGENREHALAMAADALESSLDFYFDDRRPVPTPSAADGRPSGFLDSEGAPVQRDVGAGGEAGGVGPEVECPSAGNHQAAESSACHQDRCDRLSTQGHG